MQTGPIFLTYRQNAELKAIMEEEISHSPVYDFVSEDGIGHTVWCIESEATQKRLRKAFENLDSVYIADGHHRCASAVKVGLKRREEHPDYTGEEEFNSFLAVLFPEEELMIMDYNRVLKDLNGMSEKELLDGIQEHFEIEQTEITSGGKEIKPDRKGIFFLYLNNSWYRLTAKEHCFSKDPVKNLDVSILQDRVLEPLFGIQDPKTDKRIDFVGGIRGLKELEKRCSRDCKAAFALYPTDICELFAVADAGLLMPPKSTWFEPKLRSGLFLHKIER
jgi:uncharacterized protein (DUF1015 family)